MANLNVKSAHEAFIGELKLRLKLRLELELRA